MEFQVKRPTTARTVDEVIELHDRIEAGANGKLNTSGAGWDCATGVASFDLWIEADSREEAEAYADSIVSNATREVVT